MISDLALDRALREGAITAAQAERLRRIETEIATLSGPVIGSDVGSDVPDVASRRREAVDEEKLRFVSGFADIFVTLGLVLFCGAAGYILSRYVSLGWTSAALAALSWALAEFFTRRKRMALPSIALLILFAGASFTALTFVFGSTYDVGSGAGFLSFGSRFAPGREPLALAGAALATAGLAALHFWRFRVPITVASGVAALSLTVLALFYALVPELMAEAGNAVVFALGIVVFALAMRFDLADPARATRRTDIAFWLHLLASPLIVHSVFRFLGASRGTVEPGTAVGVIAVFLGLALVALVVDRRAMLVSGLIYAGVAFGSLIRRAGITDLGLPVTLLVLGAFVLLLSAGWTPLRLRLLHLLPKRFAARLPVPAPV